MTPGATGRAAGTASVAGLVATTAAIALNLRPGITTVGPELPEVTAYFGTGSAVAGIVTAAPVVAFALVSLAAPWLLARVSVRAGLYWALAVTGLSIAVRPWAGFPVFAVATFTAAIGIGLIAVLLPAVIRAVGSTGVLVATFTTALQAGAALGFAASVPLARALGSWQWALALWAMLAPLGILALWRSPAAIQRGPADAPAPPAGPITILRRTGTGTLAVFFGLQALVAFVVIGWLPSVLTDAGVDAQTAGGYLGVITCTAVPISFLVPPLVARSARPAWWLAGFSACTVAGILAFLVAPTAAPLLWSVVLGIGLSVFSLALTVITVRAQSTAEAIHLSSAVQGVGYLIAAVGPYAIGLARQFSAGWAVPLGALLAVALLQLVSALTIGAPRPAAASLGQSLDHRRP